MADAVGMKWEFRGRKPAEARREFAAKEARLRKLWEPRLGAQMTSLPEFDGVYRAVRRAFRQAGLAPG